MEKPEFKLGPTLLIEKLPTIRKPHPTIPKYYLYYRYSRFKCFCGNEFITCPTKVKSGHTKSCGCYNKYRIQQTLSKGARGGSRLYKIYKGMKQRCENPKNPNYHQYGGKGVFICTEWKDFDVFKKWTFENGYTEKLTIDRRDSNKGYSPDNCRWITQAQQNINKPHGLHYKTLYKGVHKIRHKWYTFIHLNKIRYVFGGFESPEEAAYVYNIAADKIHGELASLNVLPKNFIYQGKPVPKLNIP